MTVMDWLQARKQAKSGNALSRSDTAVGRRLAQAELARRRKLRWPNPLKTIRKCWGGTNSYLSLCNELQMKRFAL